MVYAVTDSVAVDAGEDDAEEEVDGDGVTLAEIIGSWACEKHANN